MIQQINLYNPAFEHKLEFLSLPGALITWGAALLLVVAIASYAEMRAAGMSAQLEQDVRARTAAQSDVGRLAAQLAGRKRDPALESEVERLEEELVRRNEVMATLRSGVIGNTEGFAEYLRAFARQSFDGLWLTGLTVSGAGQTVVLEGRALRPELVPTYVQRLNRERVMRGRVFAELEMHLPETKPDAKADAKPDAKTRVLPPFIEFRLATPPEPAAPGAAQGKAVKERYQQLADRFAKLARRERLILIVGGAAAVLVIGYAVAEGRLAKYNKLQKQLVQVTTDTATAQAQIADLTKQLAEDPNAAFRTRIADIRQEIKRIEAEVEGVNRGLVAPTRMAGLLKDMLTRNPRVQLLSLKTLAVSALVRREQTADDQSVYKHGIELTLQGGYLDLLDYLAGLERLPWQMFWGQTRINASGYPKVQMTVTVYTLSLDKNWLEV